MRRLLDLCTSTLTGVSVGKDAAAAGRQGPAADEKSDIPLEECKKIRLAAD